MKKLILLSAMFASSAFAADVYHNGYVTRNGTYVQPHYQTAPDSNPYNNYSTQGNVNPYTGQQGYVQPQPTYPQYQAPQPIYQVPTNRGQSAIGRY